MKSKKDQLNVQLYGMYLLIFSLIILFFILLNYIIVIFGDDIKTYNFAKGELKHIKNNNLSFPLPSTHDEIYIYKTYPNFDEYRQKIYSKDIYEFAQYIENNFVYELGSYDCKYYTYLWLDYWAYNVEYNNANWKAKIITTDNHVSAMIYNESHHYYLEYYEVVEFK